MPPPPEPSARDSAVAPLQHHGGAQPALIAAALAQLAEGVIVTDAAGRITFVNDAAARLHGVARLDVPPELYAETYHLLTEDGLPYPSEELPLARAVLRREPVMDARWRIRRPDGSEILAAGSACPVFGPDGDQVGAVLTLRDDTARDAAAIAERERNALAARLRDAFEQSPISTVMYDATGWPIAVNAAFERLWGAGLADVPPGYSVLADPQLEKSGILADLRRAFGLDGARSQEGAGEAVSFPPVHYDVAMTTGRGRSTWTEAHAYPVRDANGAVERVVLAQEDVTVRREAEIALREATAALESQNAQLQEQALELELANQQLQDNSAELEMQAADLLSSAAMLEERTRAAERARADADASRAAAEAANRAKSEFLAVMSHELRTPLNAIGGYTELMELGVRGPVTDEQRVDLERIQHSQRHLLGLINGVLNYARVEAGAIHYDVEDVVIDDVLGACEALTTPQVRAKRLTFRYDGDTTLRVRADREKLQQVVLNLISNAIKFTDPGGAVALRCALANDRVQVAVSDTGCGIAEDQLSRVFEPFVQVDAKLTRTHEGVGLGLAISRDLARGMGGDLIAESVPGNGSTFILTLPAA